MRKSDNTALNYIAGFLNTGLPGNIVKKTITYTATGNGKQGSNTIFTVTGIVSGVVVGFCQTDLVGAGATIEVGTSGATTALITTTTATDLDEHLIWRNATPVNNIVLNATNFPLLTISGNIIETIKVNDISAGVIDFYFIYTPLTEDGLVV